MPKKSSRTLARGHTWVTTIFNDSLRACSARTRHHEVRQTCESIVSFVPCGDGERSALYGLHVPRLQGQGRGYCPLVFRTASCHRVASISPAARCKPFRGQLTASSKKHDWQKDEWDVRCRAWKWTARSLRTNQSSAQPKQRRILLVRPLTFGRQPPATAFSPDSASSYIPAHRLVGVFCFQRAPPRPFIGAPLPRALPIAAASARP